MVAKTSRRTSNAAPLALSIVSLVSGMLLVLGALQRTGIFGAGGESVWSFWTGAHPAVRFAAIVLILGGLFGAGIPALRITWKRFAYLDLFASAGFLLAGVALLIAATSNPQYGANHGTAMALGGILVAGFVAVILSAGRRMATVKSNAAARAAAPASPPATEAGSKSQ